MSLCCLHFNIEQLSLSFSKGFIKVISLLNIIPHQACCCWELIDQSVVSPNEHYVSCLILSRSFWEITILFCTISLFFFLCLGKHLSLFLLFVVLPYRFVSTNFQWIFFYLGTSVLLFYIFWLVCSRVAWWSHPYFWETQE